MIVLDTTVLVYAVGQPHPLREPARRVLAAVGEGRVAATTTIEVLQEFCHVRSRRRGRDDAAALTRDLATVLTPLTTVTAADLTAGLGLFERHPDLGCFDAVLAAAARRLAATLVSADTAFAAALGGDHLALSDPRLGNLLGD